MTKDNKKKKLFYFHRKWAKTRRDNGGGGLGGFIVDILLFGVIVHGIIGWVVANRVFKLGI